ncbi:MAG: hypothetical protein ACYCYO_00230 [Bacilli bacterium]
MTRRLAFVWRTYIADDGGGVLDGLLHDIGMALFAITVILVAAGVLYAAISTSLSGLVSTVQNLF